MLSRGASRGPCQCSLGLLPTVRSRGRPATDAASAALLECRLVEAVAPQRPPRQRMSGIRGRSHHACEESALLRRPARRPPPSVTRHYQTNLLPPRPDAWRQLSSETSAIFALRGCHLTMYTTVRCSRRHSTSGHSRATALGTTTPATAGATQRCPRRHAATAPQQKRPRRPVEPGRSANTRKRPTLHQVGRPQSAEGRLYGATSALHTLKRRRRQRDHKCRR